MESFSQGCVFEAGVVRNLKDVDVFSTCLKVDLKARVKRLHEKSID